MELPVERMEESIEEAEYISAEEDLTESPGENAQEEAARPSSNLEEKRIPKRSRVTEADPAPPRQYFKRPRHSLGEREATPHPAHERGTPDVHLRDGSHEDDAAPGSRLPTLEASE